MMAGVLVLPARGSEAEHLALNSNNNTGRFWVFSPFCLIATAAFAKPSFCRSFLAVLARLYRQHKSVDHKWVLITIIGWHDSERKQHRGSARWDSNEKDRSFARVGQKGLEFV